MSTVFYRVNLGMTKKGMLVRLCLEFYFSPAHLTRKKFQFKFKFKFIYFLPQNSHNINKRLKLKN